MWRELKQRRAFYYAREYHNLARARELKPCLCIAHTQG
jgi:hypothetical protein